MSHLVSAVTSLSLDRSIVGDNADVIFDVDNEEVVVGGGLEAIPEGGERRRYRGTLGEVGGRAQMQNFSIPPCAIAGNNGVKVGGGGGISVGGSGNGTLCNIVSLRTRYIHLVQ
jgi:hypothetical protein